MSRYIPPSVVERRLIVIAGGMHSGHVRHVILPAVHSLHEQGRSVTLEAMSPKYSDTNF